MHYQMKRWKISGACHLEVCGTCMHRLDAGAVACNVQVRSFREGALRTAARASLCPGGLPLYPPGQQHATGHDPWGSNSSL